MSQIKSLKSILIYFFSLFCSLTFSLHAIAQSYVLDIKKIDFDNYPKVRADIWTRDPNGLDISKLTANEEGKDVKIVYKGKKDSVLSQKNKCILFLVLNPGYSFSGYAELEWYKNVLKGALSSNTIKKGDKIEILNFNHQISNQILFPSTLSFTDNVDVLHERINNLSQRSSNPNSCSNRGSLVLPAIDQAIALIKQQNLSIPAGIVVLSDDVVCLSNQLEDIPTKSRRLNIPIYGITFSAFRAPYNSIDKLCLKTFGDYYQDYARNGEVKGSVSQLVGYLNSFLVRNKGLLYTYEWETTLPKDAKLHTITLKYEELTTDYTFNSPKKNVLEWIIANPFISILIFALLVVCFLYINHYLKNQKLLQEKQKEKILELQRDHDVKSVQLSQKLQQQQGEFEQLRQREAVEKQKQEDHRIAAIKANEEKELIRQMRMRGELPSLHCLVAGQNLSFSISKPEITIGRGSDCNLVLNNPTVSKKHCKINFINNSYVIEDLRSSNGTLVNSRNIQKTVLKHGDVIRLGEVVINFKN